MVSNSCRSSSCSLIFALSASILDAVSVFSFILLIVCVLLVTITRSMPNDNLGIRMQVADDECRLARERQVLVLHIKGSMLAGVAVATWCCHCRGCRLASRECHILLSNLFISSSVNTSLTCRDFM